MNKIISIFLLCIIAYGQYTSEDTRPNILLISPGGIGIDQFKQYGGVEHKTPNIDYLADNGLIFSHFMGRGNVSSSIRAIITGISDAESGSSYRRFGMNRLNYFLIDEFNQAGYETVFVGKWPMSGNSDTDVAKFMSLERYANPRTLRFKHYWGIHTPSGARGEEWGYIQKPSDAYRDKDGIFTTATGILSKGINDRYNPNNSARYINNFLEYRQKIKERKPFFIWWAMIYMYHHATNWISPTPDFNTSSSDNKVFASNVRYMDKLIGRVVDGLKKYKILDNTIIMFTSLSGTTKKIGALKGVRGIYNGKEIFSNNYPEQKNDIHEINEDYSLEQNYRVPMIIHWPRYIKKKRLSSKMFAMTDLLKTLAKIGKLKGANKYLNSKSSYKSYSFLPVIKNHSNKGERRIITYLYLQPIINYAGVDSFRRIAQTKKYKLYAKGDFYNILTDPLETTKLTRLTPLEKAIKKTLKFTISKFPGFAPPSE